MKQELVIRIDETAFPVFLFQSVPKRVTKKCPVSYSVQYGQQIKTGLDYTAAAHEFGLCLFHGLACSGKLNNEQVE